MAALCPAHRTLTDQNGKCIHCLMEARRAVEVIDAFRPIVDCRDCNGMGYRPREGTCETCDGRGILAAR